MGFGDERGDGGYRESGIPGAMEDDGLWEEVLRLRGQIEEARSAWWSATEQCDNGLVYNDRIEDAMDDIWSAIGHVEWTPDGSP